jgi:DedD protein
MDQQLKQRLVGLAVIFSLAVIFVPMLLDGPGPEQTTLEVEIPPAPEMAPLPQRVEEQVIELRRETDAIEPLQPRIVDEISDPPGAGAGAAAEAPEPLKETVAAANPAPTGGASRPAERDAAPVTADKPAMTPEAPAAAKSGAEPASKPETKPAPKPEPVAKPRPEAKPLPKPRPAGGDSFIVQLGSFTDKDKAYRLRDRVRKLKLGAVFIEKFARGKTTFYRVRVGPFISRDKARVTLNKLRAKYNIKGQVMSYDR